MLHFLFQLTQQLGHVEIAARFLNNGSGNFASSQDCMQTLLHGAPDGLRRYAVLFVVFHLLGTAIFGNRHQCFHAVRDCIREEHHFAIHMSRRTACGLDKGSLAPQKSFLVRVENADERNFGKIEAFPQQIDPDQDIEIGRAQAAQNLDALDRVDIAMEITHFQSDIAQIIGEIFGRAFRQRCHQNALAPFRPAAGKARSCRQSGV